jgi:hypothetical protein
VAPPPPERAPWRWRSQRRLAGGGLVVELEVSTHVAVSLRGSVDAVLDRASWLVASTAMVGATVY